MQNRVTATSDVYNHMVKNGYITNEEAHDLYGVNRLSGIIWSLKKQGYKIETELVPHTTRYKRRTRYAKYYIKED